MAYLGAFLLFVIDQVAKFFVQTQLQVGESVALFGDAFRLTFIRNPGAAWGLFSGQRWLLVTAGIAVMVVIFLKLRQTRNRLSRSGLVLVLGGDMGNTMDRVLWGSVVDFFDVRIIHYPIFNTADIFLVSGVLLILLNTWNETRKVYCNTENGSSS